MATPSLSLAHGPSTSSDPHPGPGLPSHLPVLQSNSNSNQAQRQQQQQEQLQEQQHLSFLTSIVHKNLRHQADWSSLTIHDSPRYPRPLISGIPPETIYVEPGKELEGESKNVAAAVAEWVLPVDLREKWTLRKWAEVFDSIDPEPLVTVSVDLPAGEVGKPSLGERVSFRKKRLVMAIVSNDSTVVYYIVHDGIVKPRQN